MSQSKQRTIDLMKSVIEIVETRPPSDVRLDTFISKTRPIDPENCKTIACAIGWACLSFEFQKKSGLTITWEEDRDSTVLGTPSFFFKGIRYPGFEAIEHAFGMDEDDVYRIFGARRQQDGKSLNDKELFLVRARDYIRELEET